MSTPLIPAREDDIVVEPADGPGQRLRAARQARQLTQAQVADELHLGLAVIKSLECDDYDALPNEVFIAGYIRKYARLVGLDPEPLLATRRTTAPRTAPQPAAAQAGSLLPAGFRINRNYLLIGLAGLGILILLGVLALLWWQDRQSDVGMETTADEVAQETAPAATLEGVAGPRTPFSPTDTDLIAVGEAEPALPPGSGMQTPEHADPPAFSASQQPSATTTEEGVDGDTTAPPDPEEAEKTEATNTAKAGEVEIIFDGRCWVKVSDKEKKYKFSGIKKKGERYVPEGEPPYSIILGNPAVVRITVGGEPFDLSAVSRGTRARFTLDPDKLP